MTTDVFRFGQATLSVNISQLHEILTSVLKCHFKTLRIL